MDPNYNFVCLRVDDILNSSRFQHINFGIMQGYISILSHKEPEYYYPKKIKVKLLVFKTKVKIILLERFKKLPIYSILAIVQARTWTDFGHQPNASYIPEVKKFVHLYMPISQKVVLDNTYQPILHEQIYKNSSYAGLEAYLELLHAPQYPIRCQIQLTADNPKVKILSFYEQFVAGHDVLLVNRNCSVGKNIIDFEKTTEEHFFVYYKRLFARLLIPAIYI